MHSVFEDESVVYDTLFNKKRSRAFKVYELHVCPLNPLAGAHKSSVAQDGVNWNVAMRPGKRAALDKTKRVDQVERLKASIRAKVEHPFLVMNRQFGHFKVRCCGLKKDTAQLTTLFAMFHLWMARSSLLGA